MKMNWGWKLAIGSALFMAMIIYFVVQSFNNKTHLVSENYYEEELKFQNQIDAKQNAEDLRQDIIVTQENGQIMISYPEEFELGNPAKGELHFYHVANSEHDKVLPCDFSLHHQTTSESNFAKGRYKVKANISSNGKEYYFEKNLTIQ